MSVLDWSIVAGFVLALCGASWVLSRVSSSVADFMAAGRCAGRFVLSMANDMGGFAAIFVVATFEQFYVSGFPGAWWSIMTLPLWAFVMFSGWVQFRFRETRALTMPGFFAQRYSSGVRKYAGVLAFVSGVMNYGIFPAVTANLIVAFCGLPQTLSLGGPGGFELPTMLPVMVVILGIAMFVLLTGGLVSVMVTDFLQGLLVIFGTLAIVGFIVYAVGWDTLFDGAASAPAGESKVDPYDQAEVRSFNFWFFMILTVNRLYSFMAFPTRQGYDAAALSPEEARFSRMLGDWMFNVRAFVLMLLPIAAWVVMHHVDFTDTAAAVQRSIAAIDDEQVQKQMTVPIVLSELLPVGLMGLFVAMMVGAAVSTDNTFVHSWGSIFVHDVVEPIRDKPLSEKAKLRLLRGATLGVAVFALVWSYFFPIGEYIFMYFQITSSIYVAGAGALVIGGLYWSRGTAAGAWAALTTGLTISFTGIILRLVWPYVPALAESRYESFPINGVWVFFIAMGCSVAAYVVVSLLTCRTPHDMDQMLHRTPAPGSADAASGATSGGGGDPHAHTPRKMFDFKALTPGSRWTVILYLSFVGLIFGAFVLGNIVSRFVEIPDSLWVNFWQVFVGLLLAVASVMAVVFLLGGVGDIRRLYRLLGRPAETEPAPEKGSS
ncbi:MAG: sodium:solute symporter [Planctomycetota bacterium]